MLLLLDVAASLHIAPTVVAFFVVAVVTALTVTAAAASLHIAPTVVVVAVDMLVFLTQIIYLYS